jgi:hypothetical protein
MGVRLAGGVAALFLVAAGSAGAARQRPPVVLRDGETRWFAPGELRTGQPVVCGGIRAILHAPPPAGEVAGDDAWSWSAGAPQLSIDRQPDGATEIRCGAAAPSRRPMLPYVIGQNGVGLIRGKNRYGALTRLYGQPQQLEFSTTCRATWPAIGLVAAFDGLCSSKSAALTGAEVSGREWSSLSGVHIGDSLAEMRWQNPGAKQVSRDQWLLASGRGRHGSKLYALVAAGRVTAFVAAPR